MTRRRLLALAAPVLVVLLLTALVPWPHPLYMATRAGVDDDPMFSIWRLAWVTHGVRYVVVHRTYCDQDAFDELLARMAARPELRPHGQFADPVGDCQLFVLGP